MQGTPAGPTPKGSDNQLRLVVLICVAQIFAQLGAYAFPALSPGFQARWGLDNSEIGWLTGLFYGAYTVTVPVLVALTDRIDPKVVYLGGVGLTILGHLGFAFIADGFWTAMAARIIAGVGWAGTYMTGLKLLSDRVDAKMMSRAVTGHVAGIGVAGALSFQLADMIASGFGWQAAFMGAAGTAATAWLAVFALAPWQSRLVRATSRDSSLFDFRSVVRNRSAMAYSIAYCVHTWEMNVLRGWAVLFLAYIALQHGEANPWIAPTSVAAAMGLLGTGASVLGNEASIRLGRQRLVRLAMALSMVVGLAIGFLGPFAYGLAAGLVLLYGILIWLDSSSLTAGAAGHAHPDRRGATLGFHSMLGYGGGFVGPVTFGLVLDLAGGQSHLGWGIAFACVAFVSLIGRICFIRLRPADMVGDAAPKE